MTLNQSQVALLVGFCLSVGMKLPTDFPKWNGTNIDAFDAGKHLGNTTERPQGANQCLTR